MVSAILIILTVWAVAGIVYIEHVPAIATRRRRIVNIILGGPVVWIIVIVVTIRG